MEIKGLEYLRDIKKLNVRAFNDQEGWHLEIWKEQEGVSYTDPTFWKRIAGNVVVDLAKLNNCNSAAKVKQLYDELMDQFIEGKIQAITGNRHISNGSHSICDEVDKTELNLLLSSEQLQALQNGLISIGNDYTNGSWDTSNKEYKGFFELLAMLHLTKRDKKSLKEIIAERSINRRDDKNE